MGGYKDTFSVFVQHQHRHAPSRSSSPEERMGRKTMKEGEVAVSGMFAV